MYVSFRCVYISPSNPSIQAQLPSNLTLFSPAYAYIYFSYHSSVLLEKEDFRIRFLRTPLMSNICSQCSFLYSLCCLHLVSRALTSTYLLEKKSQLKKLTLVSTCSEMLFHSLKEEVGTSENTRCHLIRQIRRQIDRKIDRYINR